MPVINKIIRKLLKRIKHFLSAVGRIDLYDHVTVNLFQPSNFECYLIAYYGTSICVNPITNGIDIRLILKNVIGNIFRV